MKSSFATLSALALLASAAASADPITGVDVVPSAPARADDPEYTQRQAMIQLGGAIETTESRTVRALVSFSGSPLLRGTEDSTFLFLEGTVGFARSAGEQGSTAVPVYHMSVTAFSSRDVEVRDNVIVHMGTAWLRMRANRDTDLKLARNFNVYFEAAEAGAMGRGAFAPFINASAELIGARFARMTEGRKLNGVEMGRIVADLGFEVRLDEHAALKWTVAGGELSSGYGNYFAAGESYPKPASAAFHSHADFYSRLELRIRDYLLVYLQGGVRGTQLHITDRETGDTAPRNQLETTYYGQGGLLLRY